MFSRIRRNALLSVFLLAACLGPPSASADSAIFGGGPFYSGGQAVMDDLRGSGFTTVMLWSIHVEANTGNLYLNDKLVASNGAYVGDAAWSTRLATLKQAPTSVNRIEISIGSGGVADFEHIRDLIAAQGTGSTSILYRNFQALKAATGADAANFDDESAYDLNSATQFGNMLWGLGYSITFTPYTQQAFWQSLKNNLAGKVDGIYLQVYDGGALNDPGQWSTAMGMTVDPGLWSKHGTGCSSGDSPATVQSKMTNWVNTVGIAGGFIWLYDDIQACSAQGTAAQYAAAINNAVDVGKIPVANFSYSVNGTTVSFTDASSDPDGTIVSRSWNFGDGGTSTATSPAHTYAANGSYTVTLTVTDNDGRVASRTDTISVGEVNLALNKTATGSTACNANESPAKAVNGSVSGGTTDKFCSLATSKWLRVDLGSSQTVKRFVVKHAGAGGESTAWNSRDFNIQTSSNGISWTTVTTVSGNTASTSTHAITARTARYVRLNITTPAQDGNPAARIYEFEVY